MDQSSYDFQKNSGRNQTQLRHPQKSTWNVGERKRFVR